MTECQQYCQEGQNAGCAHIRAQLILESIVFQYEINSMLLEMSYDNLVNYVVQKITKKSPKNHMLW